VGEGVLWECQKGDQTTRGKVMFNEKDSNRGGAADKRAQGGGIPGEGPVNKKRTAPGKRYLRGNGVDEKCGPPDWGKGSGQIQ